MKARYKILLVLAAALIGAQALDATPRRKSKKNNKTPATEQQIIVKPLAKNLVGEWTVTAVGNKKVTIGDDEPPYLVFDGDGTSGRVYGNNGCNVVNGDYRVNGNEITFSHMLSTMRYCPDSKYDAEINAVVADGARVTASIRNNGKQTFLHLLGSSPKSTITLCRHNLAFLDGNWAVVQINGNSVNDDEANIFFDVNSQRLHGNTGCNYFNGTMAIDPSTPGAVGFAGMGVTRMACPSGKSDQERLMLVALEQATAAMPQGDNTAVILGPDGNQLLVLERLPMTPAKPAD